MLACETEAMYRNITRLYLEKEYGTNYGTTKDKSDKNKSNYGNGKNEELVFLKKISDLELSFRAIEDHEDSTMMMMPAEIKFAFDLLKTKLDVLLHASQSQRYKGIDGNNDVHNNNNINGDHGRLLQRQKQKQQSEIIVYSYKELSRAIRTNSSWISPFRERWLITLPDSESVVEKTLEKVSKLLSETTTGDLESATQELIP